ncbi:hypothetical protein BV20DRAFT_1038144 [Pilatotrama ljubarskyi]|nr:hypothetical protein BV20DRAFT_1038144 [Pilatotrama ljubarskyi]
MATPAKALAPTPRLLYRGSLSLPDSFLLLDGLSFTTRTGNAHNSPALLNNPLALTLESMRGLPLHFLDTVKVTDTWIDPPGDILVDIHPDATLTMIYFENIFCLRPVTSANGRTEYGVRVSLTENNDPDTPDLLIYGELRDAPPSGDTLVPSTSSSPQKTLHLLAARILPGPPPPPTFRLPRPDDPTPRRPPPTFNVKRKRDMAGLPFDLTASGVDSSKRTKTGDKGKGKASLGADGSQEAMRKAAAEVMLRMPKPSKNAGATQVSVQALGKDARVGARKEVFKVPSLPARAGGASRSEPDVFGTVNGEPPDGATGDGGIERENKTAVKRAVKERLGKQGISKTHSEFKELFQICYQGASFALVSFAYASATETANEHCYHRQVNHRPLCHGTRQDRHVSYHHPLLC